MNLRPAAAIPISEPQKSKIIFYIVSLASLCFSTVAESQEKTPAFLPDTLVNPSLSEVVISASRFSSPIRNTSEAIDVIKFSSEDNPRIRSAPESLILMPAVFIQKTNHGGGSPFIRGLTGNQTLLMIDGIRLSNSTMRYGPNQYFNTIDIFSIDRIEVLRGSGSVQYGSDALGGTVQAFTEDIKASEKHEWHSRIISRFATQGMEQSINLNVKYSNKFSALRGGITYRDFGDMVGGDTTGRQTPTGYKEIDYDLKGKLTILKQSNLTFVFQNVHQRNIPVYHKIMLENYKFNKTDPQKRQLAYLRLNQNINKGLLNSMVLTGSFQQTDEGRSMMKNGSETIRDEYDKVKSYGLSAELLFSGEGNWTGNLGMDIYSDNINSSRADTEINTGDQTIRRGLYPDGSSMMSAALFSIHTLELGPWSLSAGGRFNMFAINVNDSQTGSVRLNPSALVGNLGVLRKLAGTSSLFLSLNTGFRAPNIDDLGTLGIVDFRYETPNLDLKPERSVQYQLGYRFDGSRAGFEVYVYRNELYDLITRMKVDGQTIDGYPVYQKINSDRAYIHGFETSLNLSVTRFFKINGDLTYTFGQNITQSEPLRRIPPLFGRVAAEYRRSSFSMGMEWLAAGRQDRLARGDIDDNRIPEGGTPGWDIFNLYSDYSWKILNIGLSLNNILNRDYRYHGSGINGYGRSANLTMQISF